MRQQLSSERTHPNGELPMSLALLTEDTEDPVCPHCGDIPKNWGESELRNGDPVFWTCMICTGTYRVVPKIRIRFTTTKIPTEAVR